MPNSIIISPSGNTKFVSGRGPNRTVVRRSEAVSSTPDWEIVRDFNSGVLGTSAQGQPDGFDLGGSQTLYTTEQVYSGTQSVKSTIQPGQTGTFQFGGWINVPTPYPVRYDTIWFDGYYYVPSSFIFGSGRTKFLRFRPYAEVVPGNGKIGTGYLDTYINQAGGESNGRFRLILEQHNQWTNVPPNSTFLRDQWVRISYCATFDTVPTNSGGQARQRLWENGVLLADVTNRPTLNYTDSEIRDFLNFTYWNNEDAPQVQSLYIDQIRLAKNGIPSWAVGLEGI